MTEPKGKRITVTCYGPIAHDPRNESPWEDVWIRWRNRPGRPVYEGPVLCTAAGLESDISINRECAKTHPELEWDAEYAELQTHLATVQADGYAHSDGGRYNTPEIWTLRGSIDRGEAERMLAWHLLKRHGIRQPNFKWRRPRYFIGPIGI